MHHLSRIGASLLFLTLGATATQRSVAAVTDADQGTVRMAHTDPRRSQSAVIIPGMTDNDIVELHTRVAYTTVIMLPSGEKILDWLIGDKSRWVLEGVENFAYLRPAEPNIHTNVNLITSAGRVYTFDVDETTTTKVPPDLKVIVRNPAAPDLSSSSTRPDQLHPRFVAYEDMQKAQKLAEQTAVVAQTEIERQRQNVATQMHFDYEWKTKKKNPFHVLAIYNDGNFTYIQVDADSSEKPALYVIRDGKPELTNYVYSNGVYTVTGVIDKGYLRAGKSKLDFARKGKK